MSEVDIKTVEKLAQLSRLDFNEEEKATLQEEFGKIFDFVSQLQEVNTDNIEGMTSVINNASTPQREDNPQNQISRDNLQSNAPSTEMGFFVVPKVID
ncbi:MAG: Glutamyl-tRNA(Gln) amidotransferase subunit C [Proteobacteria bacterium]|nr:MAG: Glutamyl-tRNA(Gln) amidotransferase subunit C [Pseudomonadota bacterium]|tara:strand:+ start:95 stop:388 length:294 start_codon:yes stop_codon:yes gene_type:complete